MRRIIKWVSGIVVFILLLLVAAPFLFKGKIVSAVKTGLNENLKARSDFSDASLSFFRSFPQLSIVLNDLTIDGVDEFEDIPLFHAKEAMAAVNFWSLISKDQSIEIVNLSAESPLINILVLEDGRANYDITIATEETEPVTENKAVKLEIDRYGLTNGILRYTDHSMPMWLYLEHFDHSGKGDFASMRFDLTTQTSAERFSLNYDGITYLDNVRADLDAILDIDLNTYRYALKDNHLLLNALEINGEGFVDLNEEDIELDLALTSPRSDFRQLFSILPGAYTEAFDRAEISGNFNLGSRIWGRYSDGNYPAFTLKTRIEDGAVKYPDLPMGISNINLDLSIDKPDGIMDLMKILLTKMQLQVGPQPLSGNLAIRTPVSDPDVEGSVKGTLDLSNLAKVYPLPSNVQNLTGKISSNIRFKARMSQVERKEYDKMQVMGNLTAEDLTARMAEKPEVKIARAHLAFSPQSVKLSETRIQAGRSDLTMEGSIDNILALVSPDKTLSGKLHVRSGLLDLDEWSSGATDTVRTAPVTAPSRTAPDKIPAYELDLDLAAEEVLAKGQKLSQTVISGSVTPEHLRIRELSAAMQGSDMQVQGELNQWSAYLAGDGKLTGNLQLRSRTLDLNPFMSDTGEETTDTAHLSPFIIPDDIDLTIDARVGELKYTDMTFNNLQGKVLVSEQTATLDDCSSEAFGGKFHLVGGYRTIEGEKPRFDLKYDMTGVQFSQMAEKVSYLRILTPIIKFLDGRFSTSLVTDGSLNDNFMPDLSSLNLAGLIETSEAVLKTFGPAEELAKRLKIKFLESPRIKNTKNWLEIRNGVVEIKEFDYTLEDIAMQISGTQALTQDLNFLIKMKIPRKYMDATELTQVLNEQFSWLTAEASKLGFKLSDGEFINVNIMMTGTMTKPAFDLKLVGMDGERPLVDVVKDEVRAGVEHLVDSAKAIAEEKKDSLIRVGEEAVEKIVDTLAGQAQKVVDSLAARATEEMKKKLDEELSKKAEEVIGEKVGELGAEKAREEVGKVVDKLKGWKPFGKKDSPPADTTKTEPKKESE